MWFTIVLKALMSGLSRKKLLPAVTVGSGLFAGLFLAYVRGVVLRPVQAPEHTMTKPPGTIRFVTLNVAHGRGLALYQGFVDSDRIRSNLEELGDYLKGVDADVVGLQEIDRDCNWSGNFDQLEVIARRAEYPYCRFGINNRNGGNYRLYYGNAILSRYPIVRFQNHPFGDAKVAEKGFLVADIDINGQVVTCVVTHLDPIRKSERQREVRRMVETLEEETNPLVVMGDFNCELEEHSPPRTLCNELDLKMPAEQMEGRETYWQFLGRTIDFVMTSREAEVSSYRVGKAKLSDHHPVIADLILEPGCRAPDGVQEGSPAAVAD